MKITREKLKKIVVEEVQNSPEMREEVFHAILRYIKEDLSLTRGMDTGQGYFE